MPDGLLMYATEIVNILEHFGNTFENIWEFPGRKNKIDSNVQNGGLPYDFFLAREARRKIWQLAFSEKNTAHKMAEAYPRFPDLFGMLFKETWYL